MKNSTPNRPRRRIRRARPLLLAVAGAALLAGCGDNSSCANGTCPDASVIGDMGIPVRGG
jgi:hypothetical protein